MIQAIALCGALLCLQPMDAVIEQAAVAHGVDPELMLCMARLESNFDPLAVGDQGRARGLFQFWPGTWEWMRGLMGKSTRDRRHDPVAAADTAAWAISQGYGRHWLTAWRICR